MSIHCLKCSFSVKQVKQNMYLILAMLRNTVLALLRNTVHVLEQKGGIKVTAYNTINLLYDKSKLPGFIDQRGLEYHVYSRPHCRIKSSLSFSPSSSFFFTWSDGKKTYTVIQFKVKTITYLQFPKLGQAIQEVKLYPSLCLEEGSRKSNKPRFVT